jgi:hypothetical protein
MKRIVTLIIALLPVLCQAQKFKLGLGGGIATISPPSNPDYLNATKSKISPCAEIFGAYQVSKRVRVGLQVSIAKLYTTTGDYLVGVHPQGTNTAQQFIVGSPSFIITPFVSYKIGGLYFGIQEGVFTTTKHEETPDDDKLYYGGETGLMAGLHVGYEHKISNNILLYAQSQGNFMHTQWLLNKYQPYDLNFLHAQLTAGARLLL